MYCMQENAHDDPLLQHDGIDYMQRSSVNILVAAGMQISAARYQRPGQISFRC